MDPGRRADGRESVAVPVRTEGRAGQPWGLHRARIRESGRMAASAECRGAHTGGGARLEGTWGESRRSGCDRLLDFFQRFAMNGILLDDIAFDLSLEAVLEKLRVEAGGPEAAEVEPFARDAAAVARPKAF